MDEKNEFLGKYEKRFVMDFSGRVVTEKNVITFFDFWKTDKNNSDQMNIWLDDIKNKIIERLNTGKNIFSISEIEILVRTCIGKDIRDFDMSAIINKGNIKSVKPVQAEKKVIYEDPTVRITRLGELLYTTALGVENFSGPSFYMIEKFLKDGKTETSKVFSQINTILMQDDASYRDAVIYTLLDNNNIRRSNCYGYIGSIQNIAVNSKIKANEEYSLVFDNDDASAVAKLAEQSKAEPTVEESKDER